MYGLTFEKKACGNKGGVVSRKEGSREGIQIMSSRSVKKNSLQGPFR